MLLSCVGDSNRGSMDDNESHLDRLSELPLSLILHILSFLPIRDVVSTTLLSKNWENLWTIIPCLNFTDITSIYDVPHSQSLRNFVNRALIIWKGGKLLKFSIEIEKLFDKSLARDMDLWVRFAVKNEVEELNILLEYADDMWEQEYSAPQCLNLCSSIKILSLEGCNLRLHGSPTWNQLTSLRINGFYFSEDMINRILLGAPQLEEFELCLVKSTNDLNIQSTSLKKLKIDKYLYFHAEQPSLDTVLRIYCPNLDTLEIWGVFYGKCLFTNFSSLTDAALQFYDSHYHENFDLEYYDASGIELLGETMRHIFSMFQHVERLTLSSGSFQVIRASQKKNLFSPLPNVVFLQAEVYSIELVEIVNQLEIFPNLKMLVINDCTLEFSPDINEVNSLEFETNLSKPFLLQLKIIKIISDVFDSSMFWCIEFLLKHCSMLEKLDIRPIWKSSDEAFLLQVAERLLGMPRSSPNAKVLRESLKKNLFPPFPNVVFLKVGVNSSDLIEMVHLLGIFPNLKMLVIDERTSQYSQDISTELCLELSTSYVLQLKKIEIISQFFGSSMYRCVEFLLKHGSMLEKLVVRTQWIMEFVFNKNMKYEQLTRLFLRSQR